MKNSIFGLAVAAILLSACSSKDKDATPQNWYLTETLSYDLDVAESDTSINQIKYASGRMSEMAEIWIDDYGKDTSIAKLVYNNDRLSSYSYLNSTYQVTFEYKNNLLAFVNETDGGNSRRDSLVYNAQGKVTERYNTAGNEVYKVTWEGNNVKSYTRYNVVEGVETAAATTTFSYDNKPSIYKLFTDNFLWKADVTSFEYLSANNVTKEEYKPVGGEDETTTYEYVYDGNNLLTEMTTTQVGGYGAGKRTTKLKYTKL